MIELISYFNGYMACRLELKFRSCHRMGNDFARGINLNSRIELISIMKDTWLVRITACISEWKMNFDISWV